MADAPARLRANDGPEGRRLLLVGALDAAAAARLWRPASRAAAEARRLVIDASGVTNLDTAGAALLLHLAAMVPGTRIEPPAAAPLAELLARSRRALAEPPPPPPESLSLLARIGRATLDTGQQGLDRLSFLGETTVAALALLLRPWRLRFAETLRHLDEAGLRAFGLTALLGVLLGLILAFQSSIPMRRFGAEIFIPNLVGISLLRELGPLMAAIILSGRTGSAFAAELGTMSVNEEVDALRIMGIDPLAWLVLPRLLAAVLVMPVLALLFSLAGLLGMGGVMLALGFPPIAVMQQVQNAVELKDLLGGMFKAAVFGLAVGLIGCRAGLAAGRGPRAVGDAATAAVVGGIVGVVLLDGIFAVVFNRLGW